MNQKQKQINRKLLAEEKDVVRNLEEVYKSSLEEVKKKIVELSQHEDMQSKVYQKKYQQALYDQLSETVRLLDSGKIKSVDDFLHQTAETSFIGTLYELNEDVPLLLPIDNKTIAGIVNKKIEGFKFSQRLHKDTKRLARVTVSEISRGLSVGLSYQDMARNISNVFASDFKKAYRIAQTEGHRISQETAFDTAKRFREKGADIVKQWDSTMDRKTRPHHVKLDGQTKELDEPFEVEGHKAMYPGAFGIAKEDIRCRCVMVKRARWILGTDETKFDGEKDKIVKIKAKDYTDFNDKYHSIMTRDSKNDKIKQGRENFLSQYRESSDTKEAIQYITETLGLEYAEYDKFDIKIANMVNREISKAYDVFGDIHESGYLNRIMIYPKKTEAYAAYVQKMGVIYMKNVKSKSTYQKMKKNAEEQFEIGFWSTSDAEHAIRHELGHAIEHMYTDTDKSKLEKISFLRKGIMKRHGIQKWNMEEDIAIVKKAGEDISYYALYDDGEFIAECVAEYMAGNPRTIAKKVVEILLS